MIALSTFFAINAIKPCRLYKKSYYSFHQLAIFLTSLITTAVGA